MLLRLTITVGNSVCPTAARLIARRMSVAVAAVPSTSARFSQRESKSSAAVVSFDCSVVRATLRILSSGNAIFIVGARKLYHNRGHRRRRNDQDAPPGGSVSLERESGCSVLNIFVLA